MIKNFTYFFNSLYKLVLLYSLNKTKAMAVDDD
ncbi:hypothetical protein SAMN05216556_10431 [Aequorivita viscosa]|nr:hypothetical protein SAMN05216556_10431 [Aequorivita viscosa]